MELEGAQLLDKNVHEILIIWSRNGPTSQSAL